jgi:hypothetical protein
MIGLTKEDAESAVAYAKTLFAEPINKIKAAAESAVNHVVQDEDSLKVAVSAGGSLKRLINAIEAQRKTVIAGPDAFVRGVNSFCKIFKDEAQKATGALNRKCSTYKAKVESERRARDAKAREEAERLQKEINAKAEAGGYEAPEVVVVPEDREESVTRTEDGSSAHTRKTWTFEVVDFTKVPDRYKTLNEKMINADIRAGIREADGLRIFQKETTVFKG